MRRAIISDIHANIHALDAVLKDIERQAVETIICLGDVVGYGAFPEDCVTKVRERCSTTILGNHDYMAGNDFQLEGYFDDARKSLEWTRGRLNDADRAFLNGLPILFEESQTTYVHASLHEPTTWEYLDFGGDFQRHFALQKTPVCFVGHTHMPGIFTNEVMGSHELTWNAPISLPNRDQVLVNAGSVGQPRDQEPRACYVIYDEMQRVVTFRRVNYEIQRAQNGIRAVKLPVFLAERLAEGV